MAEIEYIPREAAIIGLAASGLMPHQIDDAAEALWLVPAADVVSRDCYDRLLAENDELRKERPVRHGRWVLYSPFTDTFECDKCGYQVIDESFRTNYCPNCGADMREVKHD